MSLRKRHAAHRSQQKRRSLACQLLEPRQVLSGIPLLDGGVVTLEANDDDNVISVAANRETNVLTVDVDGNVFEFPNSEVRHVNIFGNGGNDQIAIADIVRQTTTLDGGLGNDIIVGSRQSDSISGGPGSDRISGRGGNDRINGGAGNDAIDGGDGSDAIAGGEGSDLIRGGSGDDRILGDPTDAGDHDVDELSLADAVPIDRGELQLAAVDAVEIPDREAEFNDVIFGQEGNDTIRGGRGNDQIFAGPGADAVSGGSGVDYIEGGEGNDRTQRQRRCRCHLWRGGDDNIRGGDGGDYLIGGAGNDNIRGEEVHDWAFTATGPTTIPKATPIQLTTRWTLPIPIAVAIKSTAGTATTLSCPAIRPTA